MQITFGFHTNCGGLSVLSLLKNGDGDKANALLAPSVGPHGL